jgi:hypothetical protein
MDALELPRHTNASGIPRRVVGWHLTRFHSSAEIERPQYRPRTRRTAPRVSRTSILHIAQCPPQQRSAGHEKLIQKGEDLRPGREFKPRCSRVSVVERRTRFSAGARARQNGCMTVCSVYRSLVSLRRAPNPISHILSILRHEIAKSRRCRPVSSRTARVEFPLRSVV